jgi:predicted  nucleic acid-binding Zn-ribbon protein
MRGIGLGSPDTDARTHKRELQDARDTAAKYQAELTCSNLKLEQAQNETEALKKRILKLEEGEQKARRQLPISEASEKQARNRAEELEATKKSLQNYKQELKESQEELSKLKSVCERLHSKNKELSHTTSKNEERIGDLIKEKGALNAQLKSLRNERKTKSTEPSIDVFSHRLDQVSEARIKSGVDSLNDTLDNLVMEIIEKGDQLVQKHADLVRRFPEEGHDHDNPLLRSLGQNNLTPENRGLLLDVKLHDQLHAELYEMFFSQDVASNRADSDGFFQIVFDELTKRGAFPWFCQHSVLDTSCRALDSGTTMAGHHRNYCLYAL